LPANANQEAKMSAIDNLRADLARLRDEAKVQAHLGSMEARQEWAELETKWNRFASEARLHQSEDDIKSALENLGHELRSAYERLTKAI
jgi:hypothetical protein